MLQHSAALLKRRLLVDVEIGRNDESYQWFLQWMSRYQRSQLSADKAAESAGGPQDGMLDRILRRVTPRLHHLSVQTSKISHPNGAIHTRFALVPGPGRHILRYRSAFVAVTRTRDTKAMDLSTGTPWETVTLTTLYAQRHVFEQLLLDAHALAQQQQQGKTVVLTAWATEWAPFGAGPRRKRPLASVVLDKGIAERIVRDVRAFLASAAWYHERGIPYRRGYLLHGPPGSGKSSFIQALAGALDCNIALLNLSERGLTDDRLAHLLHKVPPRTLVLLEDVDAAFGRRRAPAAADAHGYRGANVTFSGLLNALDGVASAEERITFLTTNHVERLDPALIRPGRVDMVVRLGEATRWQVEQLWDRFYGGSSSGSGDSRDGSDSDSDSDSGNGSGSGSGSNADPDGAYKRRFLRVLEELDVIESATGEGPPPRHRTSVAALQGLFLFNKDNPQGAIEMASVLVQPPPSSSSSSSSPDTATVEEGREPESSAQPLGGARST